MSDPLTPARVPLTFTSEDYAERLEGLRDAMEVHGLDACVLTSPWNLTYYAGLTPVGPGAPAGLVVTPDGSVVISDARFGARAARFGQGEAKTFDSGTRDGFWRSAASVLGSGKAIGCEADHLTLMQSEKLNAFLKPRRGVDIALAAMQQRMVKSEAEIAVIRAGAAVADQGLAVMRDALRPGARECDIAWAARAAMEAEIARLLPEAEFGATQALVQSGPHSADAAAPVTDRRARPGDPVGLTAAPVLLGQGLSARRTLFAGEPAAESLRLVRSVQAALEHGRSLVAPDVSCGQIAAGLAAFLGDRGLAHLALADFGGGLPGEPLLALRADNDTALEPGMVIALAPMLVVAPGQPGAGGYGLQDLLLVTEAGCEVLTGFVAPGEGL